MGGFDFVGGIFVYIFFGIVFFVIVLYFGKCWGYGIEWFVYKFYNIVFVVIGIVFFWFGWFGFNGGFVFFVNLRVV